MVRRYEPGYAYCSSDYAAASKLRGGIYVMAQRAIQLDLNREQLWQWYGHIFVYMACHALHSRKPVSRQQLETTQDLGIRLFGHCQEDSARISLLLTREEVLAMQQVLDVVQGEYENSPASEHRTLALTHLFAYRALLRDALDSESEGSSP